MKVLVVLCAVAACAVAKPSGLVYPAYGPAYGYSSVVSVPRTVAYAGVPYAPAPVAYAAPAPVAYAAPAPVAYAAPAPVAYAAPAPVAYAAPAPAVVAAPAVAPVAYAAPAVVAHVTPAGKTQYHAQNELGEASYGHSEPTQTHNAVQDAHGNKVGSFSYVAPNGHVLRTDYVADSAGYRVASNALPAAPVAHLRRRRSAVLLQTPASTAPLAPLAYASPYAAAPYAPAHLAYAAPLGYASPYAAAPYAPAPLAYAAAPAVAPLAYHASPTVRHATLTTVVNNPGHAVSYRVD